MSEEDAMIEGDDAENFATEKLICLAWRDYKDRLTLGKQALASKQLTKVKNLIAGVMEACAKDAAAFGGKARKWDWISSRIEVCVVGHRESTYEIRY